MLILLACVSLRAETKVALISSEGKNSHLLDLVVAEISKRPKTQFLERQHIRQLIQEHQISLREHSASKALQAGNLLKVDIFGILNDKTNALTIFDARSGLRYSDTLVVKMSADKQADFIKERVLESLKKSEAFKTDKLKCISFLSVRNINLNRSHDSEFNALAKAVERSLVNRKDLSILERSLLDKINKEKFLPGEKLKGQLLQSMNVIDLAFEKSDEGDLLCHVYDVRAQNRIKIESVKMTDDERASVIAKSIAKHVGAENSKIPVSLKNEAKRFYVESKFWHNLIKLDKAVENAEAAYALAPNNPEYLKHLSKYLFNLAEYKLGSYRIQGIERLHSSAEKLKYSLILAERAFALKDKYRAMTKAKPDPYYSYELSMFIQKPIVTSGHTKETRDLLQQLQRRWRKRLREAYEYRKENLSTKPQRYIDGFFYYFPSEIEKSALNERDYNEEIVAVMKDALTITDDLPLKKQVSFIKRLYQSLDVALSRRYEIDNQKRSEMIKLFEPLTNSPNVSLKHIAMKAIFNCRHYRSQTKTDSKNEDVSKLFDYFKRQLDTIKEKGLRAEIYNSLRELSWSWYDYEGRVRLSLEAANYMIKNQEIAPHIMSNLIYLPYRLAKKRTPAN